VIENLVERIRAAAPPAGMTTKVVAIDGPGGAGKSTLARQLAEALDGAPIVQTDDFASWDDPLDWWPRLRDEVLAPLARNEPARYRCSVWGDDDEERWQEVEPADAVVLEGVSSSREAFRPYLAFSIWVETPGELRLARGLARDGEEMRAQWRQWMAAEDEYVARERPSDHADAVVSGGG
jgi:uridine kinase